MTATEKRLRAMVDFIASGKLHPKMDRRDMLDAAWKLLRLWAQERHCESIELRMWVDYDEVIAAWANKIADLETRKKPVVTKATGTDSTERLDL